MNAFFYGWFQKNYSIRSLAKGENDQKASMLLQYV